MKLASAIKSVTVRSLPGGTIEVRPEWLVAPAVLTRMAMAAEIERILAKKLPRPKRAKR